ncbi:helix-turn-helix transcriptional regulator [Pararhodobacter oceanensis]|uniref:helix-turn-helix transcriptional regulator n=1 Tax=Pararhodobacter oceanensis TaxID=2172121 RepID=UPI003A90873D
MEFQAFDDAHGPPGLGTRASQALTLPSFSRHLNALMLATDQNEIWTLTCRFFRDLGFAHAIYGYSPDSFGAKLGAPEDYLVMSTLSADVETTLVNQLFYRQSATFHWALENAGVASWSMDQEDCGVGDWFELDPAAQEFFTRNDLLIGCTIGFPKNSSRGNAVMALVGPPDKSQEDIDALLAVAREVVFVAAASAHRCLSVLPYPTPRGHLTLRQREVLEWVAEGKTSADIATIMGISAPTVDKHLRLARDTLGVDTTAQALIKAAFLNQVFLIDPSPSETSARS